VAVTLDSENVAPIERSMRPIIRTTISAKARTITGVSAVATALRLSIVPKVSGRTMEKKATTPPRAINSAYFET